MKPYLAIGALGTSSWTLSNEVAELREGSAGAERELLHKLEQTAELSQFARSIPLKETVDATGLHTEKSPKKSSSSSPKLADGFCAP